MLALPVACGLVLLLPGLALAGRPGLFWGFVGSGAVLLAWSAVLFATTRAAGRTLTLTNGVRKHHWIQALAQLAVYAWWGWHVRLVLAFAPLILAQVVFAYGVDSLLQWSRRGTYGLGFGPFPVVFSINLFLWLRPEWYYWQFAMILVGYLGKDLVRWTREGRSSHIFNPSSLPLALFSVALIATGSTDITLGQAIATSQYYPPNMYLAIFLASLPGQVLFGVARMTMPAVVTAFTISIVYFQVTGTYLFFDSHIPVPVFLGMHLLFTDPSTAPRSEKGRIAFGVLYGSMTSILYVVLGAAGIPTFYDKLLPVPILNLMVRRIDRIAGRRPGAPRAVEPSRAPATSLRRNLAYTSAWVVIFAGLSAVQGVGDDHPGQSLPFWREVCTEGNNARACRYAAAMTRIYCGDGSGWACNEVGMARAGRGEPVAGAFQRSCELGFAPGCANAARGSGGGAGGLERAPPTAADLPIVLRGTKPPLRELSDAALRERACDQGWTEICPG